MTEMDRIRWAYARFQTATPMRDGAYTAEEDEDGMVMVRCDGMPTMMMHRRVWDRLDAKLGGDQ